MNKNNRAKVDNTKDDFEVRTKFFETKNSLLTDLCDDKDKSAVVQLFIALGAGYFGYVAIGDIFYNKGSGFGIKFVLSCFPNFGQLSALWTILFVSSLMLFIGFQFWGRLRIYLPPRSTLRKIFDAACLIGFASYWMGAFTLTSYIALTGHTAYLCSLFLS
ncbi:hypothetical protein FQR65_LT09555 [Abscondita terminalis]|nr:hypothetical protein FQR65_LT09555 [Abscondita terminalis]